MPRYVVIDEVHVTVRVPRDLSPERAERVRAALAADAFLARLRTCVRRVVRGDPDLAGVRVGLSR